jgi:hypothetical protein
MRGACGDGHGRLERADVPWGDAGAAESASPQDGYKAVGDGVGGLASRFAEAAAWFGRSTLQRSALAGGDLAAASTARQLAGLLGRVLDQPPPGAPAAMDRAGEDAGTARIASRGRRTGSARPALLSGSAVLPGDREDRAGPGEHGGPRTLADGRGPGVSARRTATAAGRPVCHLALLVCGAGGSG